MNFEFEKYLIEKRRAEFESERREEGFVHLVTVFGLLLFTIWFFVTVIRSIYGN